MTCSGTYLEQESATKPTHDEIAVGRVLQVPGRDINLNKVPDNGRRRLQALKTCMHVNTQKAIQAYSARAHLHEEHISGLDSTPFPRRLEPERVHHKTHIILEYRDTFRAEHAAWVCALLMFMIYSNSGEKMDVPLGSDSFA